MARPIYLMLLVALVVACGPGDPSTSSGGDTSTGASSTTGASESTPAPTGTTGTGTTGPATPCGCPEGQVCVQFFDGLCTEFYGPLCVEPNGCVPGNPCTPECAVFCGDEDDMVTCSDSRYCEEEVAEAVRCYGS